MTRAKIDRGPLQCVLTKSVRIQVLFIENAMNRDYVEKHKKGYRIAGTRVSLDSIVYAYLEGLRPESIADDFPALTLEEVYGAIAYYLAHREEVDAYLKQVDEDFPALQQRVRETYPLLNQKLDEAREREPAAPQ